MAEQTPAAEVDQTWFHAYVEVQRLAAQHALAEEVLLAAQERRYDIQTRLISARERERQLMNLHVPHAFPCSPYSRTGWSCNCGAEQRRRGLRASSREAARLAAASE